MGNKEEKIEERGSARREQLADNAADDSYDGLLRRSAVFVSPQFTPMERERSRLGGKNWKGSCEDDIPSRSSTLRNSGGRGL